MPAIAPPDNPELLESSESSNTPVDELAGAITSVTGCCGGITTPRAAMLVNKLVALPAAIAVVIVRIAALASTDTPAFSATSLMLPRTVNVTGISVDKRRRLTVIVPLSVTMMNSSTSSRVKFNGVAILVAISSCNALAICVDGGEFDWMLNLTLTVPAGASGMIVALDELDIISLVDDIIAAVDDIVMFVDALDDIVMLPDVPDDEPDELVIEPVDDDDLMIPLELLDEPVELPLTPVDDVELLMVPVDDVELVIEPVDDEAVVLPLEPVEPVEFPLTPEDEDIVMLPLDPADEPVDEELVMLLLEPVDDVMLPLDPVELAAPVDEPVVLVKPVELVELPLTPEELELDDAAPLDEPVDDVLFEPEEPVEPVELSLAPADEPVILPLEPVDEPVDDELFDPEEPVDAVELSTGDELAPTEDDDELAPLDEPVDDELFEPDEPDEPVEAVELSTGDDDAPVEDELATDDELTELSTCDELEAPLDELLEPLAAPVELPFEPLLFTIATGT